jgi:putative sterol carrier protein
MAHGPSNERGTRIILRDRPLSDTCVQFLPTVATVLTTPRVLNSLPARVRDPLHLRRIMGSDSGAPIGHRPIEEPAVSELANLPADITPTRFFELIATELANEPAPDDANADKLVVHLNGDAGGDWAIGFEDGKLAITAGAADSPPIQLTLSVDDWRAFVAGSVRDAVAAKVGADKGFDAEQVAQIYRLTNNAEAIKSYSGDLQMVVEDGDKTYSATLTFGGATPNPASPSTTVTVTLEDLVALSAGELNAQTAFFMGKIRLDGDMNLAMSLMALAQG